MADRKFLLDTLEAQLARTKKSLRNCSSLARCKEGARRQFLTEEFLKPFDNVRLDDFEEAIFDFMTGERPDPQSVQTLLQVMIDSRNSSCVELLFDCIDSRIGGEFLPISRADNPDPRVREKAARLREQEARRDAWWADVVTEPFEGAFRTNKRLRERFQKTVHEARAASRSSPATAQ